MTEASKLEINQQQTTADSDTKTQFERRVEMGSRTLRRPIEVTDPQVADSLNKRTVGIHQLSDIYDLQRLKKQNAMNRNLVAMQQAGLRKQMGLDNQTSGDDAMTTELVTGNEAEDDHVQIGDTSYNINVGNPEQLEQVMRQLRELQQKAQQPQQPEPQQEAKPTDAQTITTPVGTPIQVNQPPDNRELLEAIRAMQQPQQQPVQVQPTEPPKKTLGEKVLPWALAAATGLGAAGLTYGLTRPEPGPDKDTQYRLEFDDTEDPGMTIPTPRLNE